MKKLVIKTTIIALLLIVALSFIVGLIISAISPITIANASFRFGNKDLTVKYTEKHYQKTNDFNDLALLIERSIWAENDQYVVNYCPDFINSENFETYAETQVGDYTNYIASGYVKSLYNVGDVDKSIAIAFQYVDNKFTMPNPVTSLIYTASSKNDVQTLQKILVKLENLTLNDNLETIINAVKSFI